jgi:senataxin
MHPEISQLPSEVFYSRRLLDGPGMDTKTQQPWHAHNIFGPYQFFNVAGQESNNGKSLINKTECQVAASLFSRITKDFSSVNFDFRIGIVSMYRAQIAELRRVFQARFGQDIINKVDFNTVDGFQGQEKDIIILSCVRASMSSTSIGFLAGAYLCVTKIHIIQPLPRHSSNECGINPSSIIPLHFRTRTDSQSQ